MHNPEYRVRPATDADRQTLAALFAAVAEERDGIATEPPVDTEAVAQDWVLEGTSVALDANRIVGLCALVDSGRGYGEINMAVAAEWRGKGVGTSLMRNAIEQARARALHKLILSVWPHNAAAIALYKKHGFVEEGYRTKQMRRQNGELWDVLEMGLLL